MDHSGDVMISVIMPAYNCEDYITESIESILKQTYTNFEFFIIDDASTDSTAETIETFTDPRIIFIRKEKNSGYTESLNMAIARARGKYIGRMDADDISVPDRFEKQLAFMEKHPEVLVVGSNYQVIGSEQKYIAAQSAEEVRVISMMEVAVAHPTAFIRSEVFTRFGLRYDREFEPAEDYHLWTRILDYGEIQNVPEVLLYYRQHNAQQSFTRREKLIKSIAIVREQQFGKLLSFDEKPYTPQFVIDVLSYEKQTFTKPELKALTILMNDFLKANEDKGVYDRRTFEQYLRKVWMHYVTKLGTCGISENKFFLFEAAGKLTNLSVKAKVRLLIGFVLVKFRVLFGAHRA